MLALLVTNAQVPLQNTSKPRRHKRLMLRFLAQAPAEIPFTTRSMQSFACMDMSTAPAPAPELIYLLNLQDVQVPHAHKTKA
eukprot:scaffold151741_cov15-Tisochrysis_lutea.AAC.1